MTKFIHKLHNFMYRLVPGPGNLWIYWKFINFNGFLKCCAQKNYTEIKIAPKYISGMQIFVDKEEI